MRARDILITGGTGYVGRPLAAALCARGHRVTTLARPASLARVVSGTAVAGDALDPDAIRRALAPGATLVHLVGTPHPSPAKAASFLAVDLASIEASVKAASSAGVAHLVYVSVAHPAPVMQAYIDARRRGEVAIAATGLTASILRPWYVLGPGHRWPMVLLPHLARRSAPPDASRGAAARLRVARANGRCAGRGRGRSAAGRHPAHRRRAGDQARGDLVLCSVNIRHMSCIGFRYLQAWRYRDADGPSES